MMDLIAVQTSPAMEENVCHLPSLVFKQANSPAGPQLIRLQDAAKPFSFLLLPGEIRNKIYRYSLVEDLSADRIEGLVQPPLTRTNKQIRSEALPIYYGENRFRLNIPDPLYNSEPDAWPNFIRMFRAFKAGRTSGHGTHSLRFHRDMQCRLLEASRYRYWHLQVTFVALSQRRKGIDRFPVLQRSSRMDHNEVIRFWRDWESLRGYFDWELVREKELRVGVMHEKYLQRLSSTVLMLASECIEFNRGVEGSIWTAMDMRHGVNG